MIPVRGAPPGGLLGIRGDRAPLRLWTEHGCSRGSPWLLQTAPRRPAVPGALRDRALQGREQPARSMSSSRGLSVKRPRRRLPFASVSQGPLSLAQLSGQVGGQLAQAAIPRDPAGGQLRRAFIPPSPGGRTSEVTVWPGPAPPAACPWHVGVCLSAPRPRTRSVCASLSRSVSARAAAAGRGQGHPASFCRHRLLPATRDGSSLPETREKWRSSIWT